MATGFSTSVLRGSKLVLMDIYTKWIVYAERSHIGCVTFLTVKADASKLKTNLVQPRSIANVPIRVRFGKKAF